MKHLPFSPYALASALLWGLLVGLLWLWLRRELTPKRFLAIWESSPGILSTRLLAATALLVWGMAMYSAGRMGDAGLGQLLGWVTGFFAVGGVTKAVGALQPNTTVNAKTVEQMNIPGKEETPTPNAPGATVE